MTDDVDEGWDDVAEGLDWGDVEPEEESEVGAEVMRFDLAGLGFAAPIECVAEVSEPIDYVALPDLPPHVLGVAVRRQSVVTVIDLAGFLGLASIEATRIVELRVKDLDVAVEVDRVRGIDIWPTDEESTKLLDGLHTRVREFAIGARWAPGGVVVLLDIPRILEHAAVR